MRYARPIICSLLLASLFVPAIADNGSKFGNAEAITATRLFAHLQLVASDEMEGRDTPSRGLNATAKYIESQLIQWGLKPMGDDGTYFQKIPLKAPVIVPDSTTASLAGTTLKYGDQYYATATAGSASGQIVYLPSAYEKSDDPNDPYKKVDVKGKVILSINARPQGVTFRQVRSGAVLSPQVAAAKNGALGVILVAADSDADIWNGAVQRSTTAGTPLPPLGAPTTQSTIPTIILRQDALTGLLAGEPMSADAVIKGIENGGAGEPFALQASKTAAFTVAVNDNVLYTQNVVAEVEGRDPKLKSEFVAVGAHYDHLGMATSGADRIFNGADDDGSGTVSILEIAHAFATGPKPKRSIIFVWHCGEEKGLWGSGYFTTHPTVPITSIVAQLNIDMIGRSKKEGDTNPANKVLTGPNAIYLVGTTRMSSELGEEAKEVNKKLYNLTYDFTYDDLNNPERIFYRSDHFNYAAQGIPILFWFDGVHEDYHRVSDQVEKIDFQKMEKVARTVYATAWDVANRKNRPKVDKPLKPEEISR